MFSAIIAGLGFGLIMSILMGPVIFAIIKYSISYGWKAGMSFVLGVSLSDIIYVAIANIASGFIIELKTQENTIGIVGAFLLIGMGLYGYFKKIKVTRSNRDIAKVKGKHYFKIFASGFLLNTFNPGIILTWITAVAAIANMDLSYKFAFFISWLGLILILDLLKVFLAQRIRTKLTPRNIIYVHRISALCILAIGIFLFAKTFFKFSIAGY